MLRTTYLLKHISVDQHPLKYLVKVHLIKIVRTRWTRHIPAAACQPRPLSNSWRQLQRLRCLQSWAPPAFLRISTERRPYIRCTESHPGKITTTEKIPAVSEWIQGESHWKTPWAKEERTGSHWVRIITGRGTPTLILSRRRTNAIQHGQNPLTRVILTVVLSTSMHNGHDSILSDSIHQSKLWKSTWVAVM